MSEEKIIKHTGAAVHLITNKEKSWRKKILELTEEAGIIIFAVSITLAFHNWNDWRSERKITTRIVLTRIRVSRIASPSLPAAAAGHVF